MKKYSIKATLFIAAVMAFATACSTQVNQLPLPDFTAEMVKITPLKGSKYISNSPTNPAATLREATVEILPSAKNVLILRDSALQFQIQLSTKEDEISSNAVYFTIPEQIVRYNNQNVTVKGLTYPITTATGASITRANIHGLFLWKQNSSVENNLSFNVAVGTRNWVYVVSKK